MDLVPSSSIIATGFEYSYTFSLTGEGLQAPDDSCQEKCVHLVMHEAFTSLRRPTFRRHVANNVASEEFDEHHIQHKQGYSK